MYEFRFELEVNGEVVIIAFNATAPDESVGEQGPQIDWDIIDEGYVVDWTYYKTMSIKDKHRVDGACFAHLERVCEQNALDVVIDKLESREGF